MARPLRTYGVNVQIPTDWPCEVSPNGSRQRQVIVTTTSAAKALEAFNAAMGGQITMGFLRTYGYTGMAGRAAEVSQPHPGVVFYSPEDHGRDYVPAPGQTLSTPQPDPLRSLAHGVTNHAQATEKNILKGDLVMAQGHAALLVQQGEELLQKIIDTRNEGAPQT